MIHSLAFRKTPTLQMMAAQVNSMPEVRQMLSTLELDHPSKNVPSIHDGFGATQQMGIIIGFERCLQMFRDLGKPAPEAPTAIQPTWGVPDLPDKPKE